MIFGGPWGLIFALPILVAVFFHDWYKRMVPVTKGQLILICLAVAAIAFFYAYFRQQVRWENNEQTYKALKLRQEQENLTNKSD